MKLSSFTLADESCYEKCSNGEPRQRDFVLKPDKVSVYHVYRVLKDSFGNPNGKMFDEEKTQWMYSLQNEQAYLEVYDWKVATWSIGIYLKPSATMKAEEIGKKFESLVENSAGKINGIIKEKLKSPDGMVIESPFYSYRETADSLLTLALSLKDSIKHVDQNEYENWLRHYDLCKAAFIMYLASVEGFINLLYELYLRKELREKRIYERISREQIDLKLRLAPIYCECFRENVIDPENDAFRKYHSLANLRNDFVHANLTKPMMSPVIKEDGYDFVIEPDSSTNIGIPTNFRDFETVHVEIARDVTQSLIDYVVSSMGPRYRREFEKILNDEHIVVEYENGQLFIE